MKNAVSVKAVAPYAEIAIPLYLSSITGLRYRTLNCLECGAEFLERNNDNFFRLNDESQPTEVMLNGAVMGARCGNCSQQYSVMVSLQVSYESGGVSLNLQPQSIYIKSDSLKKLRYVHCLECRRPFQTISDRIAMVVDNRVPFEYLDPAKIGVIETLCHNYQCKQTWAIML